MSKECNEIQKKFNYLDGLRLTKLEEIKKIEMQIKVLKELFPENFPFTEITNPTAPLLVKTNTVTSLPSVTKKEKEIWDKTKKSNLPKNIYATPDGKFKIIITRDNKRIEKTGFTTIAQAIQVKDDIIEQLENNPDRIVTKESSAKGRPVKNTSEDEKFPIERWECMKCKQRYTTSQMPVRCVPECGSISFNMIS